MTNTSLAKYIIMDVVHNEQALMLMSFRMQYSRSRARISGETVNMHKRNDFNDKDQVEQRSFESHRW